jgi:hypothetical protein
VEEAAEIGLSPRGNSSKARKTKANTDVVVVTAACSRTLSECQPQPVWGAHALSRVGDGALAIANL